jgi:hypothetical protein
MAVSTIRQDIVKRTATIMGTNDTRMYCLSVIWGAVVELPPTSTIYVAVEKMTVDDGQGLDVLEG